MRRISQKIIGNKNDKIAYIGGRISCDLKKKKKEKKIMHNNAIK